MKKLVAAVLAIRLIFSLCSCGIFDSTIVIDESYSHEEIPDIKRGIEDIKANGTDTIKIDFDLPENGYIDFYTYQIFDDESFKDVDDKYFFFDADGKEIPPTFPDEKYLAHAKKGKLTVQIKFKKSYKKSEKFRVHWTFIPETHGIREVKVDGGGVTNFSNENNEAKFKVNITKYGLYYIGLYDYQGDYPGDIYIKKDGVKIAEYSIGCEDDWTSTSRFLAPGEYEIVGSEILNIATCEVETIDNGDDIHLDDVTDAEFPLKLGFVLGETNEKTITFTSKEIGQLIINAYGFGNKFTITATDSTGHTTTRETTNEDCGRRLNLYYFKGKVTLKITLPGSGMATLSIISP